MRPFAIPAELLKCNAGSIPTHRTFSTTWPERACRRTRIFDPGHFKLKYTPTLNERRGMRGFRMFICALMPEGCPRLVLPGELASPSQNYAGVSRKHAIASGCMGTGVRRCKQFSYSVVGTLSGPPFSSGVKYSI